jgi:ATP-binding cassette, subfamily G (WHITE), member 2
VSRLFFELVHSRDRSLCPSGTIIFSIHQPRYSIFKLFDTVLLLSTGHPVYLGPSNGIIPYFGAFGFRCEDHDNPADFALDILIECAQSRSTVLINAYSQSNRSNVISDETSLTNERVQRSRVKEFFFVAQRTLRNTVRDPAIGASQIIVAILLGLLTGLVFNQIQLTIVPGIGNRLGVIFFIVINQIYSTTTALEPLVQERALFIHVRSRGMPCIYKTFLFRRMSAGITVSRRTS